MLNSTLQEEITSLKQSTLSQRSEIDVLKAQVSDKTTLIHEFEQLKTRLENEHHTQQQKLLSVHNELQELTQRYSDLVSSLSWKMTKPLRVVKAIAARKSHDDAKQVISTSALARVILQGRRYAASL